MLGIDACEAFRDGGPKNREGGGSLSFPLFLGEDDIFVDFRNNSYIAVAHAPEELELHQGHSGESSG